MSRSKWKGPKLRSYFLRIRAQKKRNFFFRSGTILPVFLNKIFGIHNGRTYYLIKVTNSLFGFCFGEFVFTRKKTSK